MVDVQYKVSEIFKGKNAAARPSSASPFCIRLHKDHLPFKVKLIGSTKFFLTKMQWTVYATHGFQFQLV